MQNKGKLTKPTEINTRNGDRQPPRRRVIDAYSYGFQYHFKHSPALNTVDQLVTGFSGLVKTISKNEYNVQGGPKT